MIQKANLNEKFSLFDDYWHPRVGGTINDFHLKLAKVKGEFVWHHHEAEDELFLVVKGHLRINLRDQDAVVLDAGDYVIIPRGVEHQPVAEEECHIVMLEPAGTLNTGNVRDDHTVEHLDTI